MREGDEGGVEAVAVLVSGAAVRGGQTAAGGLRQARHYVQL